jgi:hypothetical protein
MRPGAFEIPFIHPVITDLRIRHGDDLPAVTGIGKDLLIAGHRRVKAHLAIDFAVGADRDARVHRTVFQSELCGRCHGLK